MQVPKLIIKAILGVDYVSRVHTAFIGEDSSILGTVPEMCVEPKPEKNRRTEKKPERNEKKQTWWKKRDFERLRNRVYRTY